MSDISQRENEAWYSVAGVVAAIVVLVLVILQHPAVDLALFTLIMIQYWRD
jgi:hypothetical protein